jgi:hypothetical protein
MSPVEIRNEFRSANIIPRFPRIMFHSVSFPFDEVTKFPIDHPTVQYLLDRPLFFSFNDLRRRRWFRTSTGNRIRDGRGQLDDIKNGVKPFHGERELQTVSSVSDLFDNRERS